MSAYGFTVPFQFPVTFTANAWDPANPTIVDAIRRLEPARRHRVLVVVDDHVARTQPVLLGDVETYCAAHATSMELLGTPMVVPGGEAAKNDIVHSLTLLQRINDVGLDRHSFVLVVGGGAALDMVSFAAAIAHRGIRVIRMPTTVLAQGDSGIAVKNGINLFGKKNFVGTFVPPFAVINDTQMLASLPLRDRIAGLSEAVKVALLKRADFYRRIERHAARLAAGDIDAIGPVARESAELHLAHICGNGDPFELGSARPLDFGHWSAHKLESMTAHRIRHGEAVSVGMALDLTYSVGAGYLDRVTHERILRLLQTLGLPVWDDALAERDIDGSYLVLRGLREFREHLGGELHITLVQGIGDSFEVTEMDEAGVALAIEALARRASQAGMATAARPAI